MRGKQDEVMAVETTTRTAQSHPASAPKSKQQITTTRQAYTLNAQKAIKKKIKACDRQYDIKVEVKVGPNLYLTFTPIMFEAFRQAIKSTKSADMRVDCDKSGRTQTREVIHVYETEQSKHAMYTVNIYLTNSSILVNGPFHGVKTFISLSHK